MRPRGTTIREMTPRRRPLPFRDLALQDGARAGTIIGAPLGADMSCVGSWLGAEVPVTTGATRPRYMRPRGTTIREMTPRRRPLPFRDLALPDPARGASVLGAPLGADMSCVGLARR